MGKRNYVLSSPESESWPLGVEAPVDENGVVIQRERKMFNRENFSRKLGEYIHLPLRRRDYFDIKREILFAGGYDVLNGSDGAVALEDASDLRVHRAFMERLGRVN
jgi:hypothetical protein